MIRRVAPLDWELPTRHGGTSNTSVSKVPRSAGAVPRLDSSGASAVVTTITVAGGQQRKRKSASTPDQSASFIRLQRPLDILLGMSIRHELRLELVRREPDAALLHLLPEHALPAVGRRRVHVRGVLRARAVPRAGFALATARLAVPLERLGRVAGRRAAEGFRVSSPTESGLNPVSCHRRSGPRRTGSRSRTSPSHRAPRSRARFRGRSLDVSVLRRIIGETPSFLEANSRSRGAGRRTP